QSCVYLLLTRPLPRPTLFPYTTLFRSIFAARPRIKGDQVDLGGDALQKAHQLPGIFERVVDAFQHHIFERDAAGVGKPGIFAAGDRKSTRLNSSHVKSSYAGFCLKKKI